ncbi:MAG: hypothetical protein CW338_01475, partial [Clostridiales bacterium]|nr:hypothetical protein [Clostridiales bacterium]
GELQPRGYILLAASPRSMSALMREQYTFLYSLVPGLTPAEQAEKDAVFAALDQLDVLYAAEPAQRAALPDEDSILGVYLPYWKWLADYDMIAAAKRITAPCLVLQGEEDYQVTMEDFTLLLNALGDLDNWRFISYPGLTHPFTPGGKQEGSAAYARPEKVAPAVMDDIAAFILAN